MVLVLSHIRHPHQVSIRWSYGTVSTVYRKSAWWDVFSWGVATRRNSTHVLRSRGWKNGIIWNKINKIKKRIIKKQTFLKSTLLLFPQMIQFCSFLFYTFVFFFLKEQTIFFTIEGGFSEKRWDSLVNWILNDIFRKLCVPLETLALPLLSACTCT